jgi:hypothetical protein
VLRNGISFNGINVQLAFFKPSAGGNPEHQARYAGNRFAIVRQIHFSTKTPDQSVDVVILISGLLFVAQITQFEVAEPKVRPAFNGLEQVAGDQGFGPGAVVRQSVPVAEEPLSHRS